MMVATRFRGGFTLGPAPIQSDDRAEARRLRRLALDAVEAFRQVVRRINAEIVQDEAGAEFDRIMAPFGPAFNAVRDTIDDAHEASGAGGDLAFVIDDDECDPSGFIWPFKVFPVGRAIQP